MSVAAAVDACECGATRAREDGHLCAECGREPVACVACGEMAERGGMWRGECGKCQDKRAARLAGKEVATGIVEGRRAWFLAQGVTER